MPLYYCEQFHSNVCSCFVTPNVTEDGNAFSPGLWVEHNKSVVVLLARWIFKASENAPVSIPIFFIPSLSAASPIALLPWLKLCIMCTADDYLATGLFYIKKLLIVPHNADGAEGCRWMRQPNHPYSTRHSDFRFTARFPQRGTCEDILATVLKTMLQ